MSVLQVLYAQLGPFGGIRNWFFSDFNFRSQVYIGMMFFLLPLHDKRITKRTGITNFILILMFILRRNIA